MTTARHGIFSCFLSIFFPCLLSQPTLFFLTDINASKRNCHCVFGFSSWDSIWRIDPTRKSCTFLSNQYLFREQRAAIDFSAFLSLMLCFIYIYTWCLFAPSMWHPASNSSKGRRVFFSAFLPSGYRGEYVSKMSLCNTPSQGYEHQSRSLMTNYYYYTPLFNKKMFFNSLLKRVLQRETNLYNSWK